MFGDALVGMCGDLINWNYCECSFLMITLIPAHNVKDKAGIG
jgi:hypothetical protein